MACRGVHFAILLDQAERLMAACDDVSLMKQIEQLEEGWDVDHLAESDKAWDAIHRTLTDGKLEFGNGEYPLNHCVLGPRQLYSGNDYIVSLVMPAEVVDVTRALEALDINSIRERYDSIVPKDYAPEYGSEDREYIVEWFRQVKGFYHKSASEGRAVLFTVDQS